jgi:hypothetical protein
MEFLAFTLRGLERSGALEARIRDLGDRLRRCDRRITLCHVTVERTGGEAQAAAAGAPESGAGVTARIRVSVPGAEIHADGVAANGTRHADAFLALRDAYESARRQLRELQREGRRTSLLRAPPDARG